MEDMFDRGEWIPLDNFAVMFDENGAPIGISGTLEGKPIVETGDVELQMSVEVTTFKLAHVHVQQARRRLCCVGGRCKSN
jgi:hypothetical protein